jgi:16S rRNA (uracil1498-N3)-methyltransferase
MPENRFYHSQLPVKSKILSLNGDELKHLYVMRPKVGETIELVDGQGHLAQAEIIKIDKRSIDLKIHTVEHSKRPSCELIMAQAIPRLSRLDVILEKGTELGMTQLWLFPAETSEKTAISPQQEQRMQHVMVAALKQCGRLYLPEIKILPPISNWKPMPYPLFFGDIRASAQPLIAAWQTYSPTEGAIFVTGPEKGLTKQEIINLEAIGAQGVTLHLHVLRTDTAPLAALSLMSHFLLAKNSMV